MSRRRSWIESANDPTSDFPLENLPFGVIERGDDSDRRIAVAIGDQVLDLRECVEHGLLSGQRDEVRRALSGSSLNALAGLGRQVGSTVRRAVAGHGPRMSWPWSGEWVESGTRLTASAAV